MMRRWLILFFSLFALLLAGCTSPVVRSDVTAFHDWPADLQGNTFTFVATPEQQNNLEYRAYQSLISEQLERLGLRPADNPTAAHLRVRFNYGIEARDVRVIQPVVADPFYLPFYRPYGAFGYGAFGYGPFYDPFWYGEPYLERRENRYVLYTRRLKIEISRASDGKNLFETTVVSEGTDRSLAAVMPYMVQSAFQQFPGKSGVPRRVELQRAQ